MCSRNNMKNIFWCSTKPNFQLLEGIYNTIHTLLVLSHHLKISNKTVPKLHTCGIDTCIHDHCYFYSRTYLWLINIWFIITLKFRIAARFSYQNFFFCFTLYSVIWWISWSNRTCLRYNLFHHTLPSSVKNVWFPI